MERAIVGGYVFDATQRRPKLGDVLIRDGRIAGVGDGVTIPEHAERIEAAGKLIIPGLINAHTHAHNNLSRGAADRWTLEDLLNHGPALGVGRSVREQYVSAALGAIEMLTSGVTGVYDLFMAMPAVTDESCEAVARAYGDSGMRAVVAPAVSDMVFYKTVPGLMDILPGDLRTAVEGIEPAPTRGLLNVMERHIRDWEGSYDGRIRTAVAPTIPGQCTDELLDGAVRLAQEHGVGFHTHLAESKMQVVYGLSRWGTTPLGRLHDIGAVDAKFVGAHGVWLSPDDLERMGSVAASVAHNPQSNLRLGSGIAPVREMLDAGVNVALGSDGSASSDHQNLFVAMHFAGTVGNVRHGHDRERWLSARDVWKMATDAGSHAMGMPGEFGQIVPGARADLVLLERNSTYLMPTADCCTAMVYAETGSAVDTVLVDGEVVVRDGVVLTLDEAALRREADEATERILGRNPDLWEFARAMTPYIHQACRATAMSPMAYTRYADESIMAQPDRSRPAEKL
jgi:5-methylthioadenosine/S-adenosylhomocysteine deaminase